jgi:hypothetical protein
VKNKGSVFKLHPWLSSYIAGIEAKEVRSIIVSYPLQSQFDKIYKGIFAKIQ